MKTVYLRIDADDEFFSRFDITAIVKWHFSSIGVNGKVIDATETVSNTRRIAEGLLEIALLMESELDKINSEWKIDVEKLDKLLKSIAQTGIISEAENLLERNPE